MGLISANPDQKIYMRIRTYTHTYMLIHIHTCKDAHMHTRTHAARKGARAHTHIRTPEQGVLDSFDLNDVEAAEQRLTEHLESQLPS